MQQTQTKPFPVNINLDHYKDLSVGQILQRCREQQNKSLPQAAQELCIRVEHLQALEQDNSEQLPGRVYAIGFVRTYAEYLGLDGQKLTYLFKTHILEKLDKENLTLPIAIKDHQTPSPWVLSGCLAFIISLLLYVSLQQKQTDPAVSIPPVPQALLEQREIIKNPTLAIAPITTTPITNSSEINTQTTEQTQPITESLLEIVATANSWVDIKNKTTNALIMRKVMKPGDKFTVTADQEYILSTGNAGGLTAFLNGKKLDKLGKNAQVRRNIDLSIEAFTP